MIIKLIDLVESWKSFPLESKTKIEKIYKAHKRQTESSHKDQANSCRILKMQQNFLQITRGEITRHICEVAPPHSGKSRDLVMSTVVSEHVSTGETGLVQDHVTITPERIMTSLTSSLFFTHISTSQPHNCTNKLGTTGKSFTFLNFTLFWVKSSIRSLWLWNPVKLWVPVRPGNQPTPASLAVLFCEWDPLREDPILQKGVEVTTCVSFTPTQHRRHDTGKVGFWEPASTKKDCVQNILPQPHTNFLCGTMSADPFKAQWQT